jgi:hypothetical protein
MLRGFLLSGSWCAYVTPLNTVHGFIANAPNKGIDASLACIVGAGWFSFGSYGCGRELLW